MPAASWPSGTMGRELCSWILRSATSSSPLAKFIASTWRTKLWGGIAVSAEAVVGIRVGQVLVNCSDISFKA